MGGLVSHYETLLKRWLRVLGIEKDACECVLNCFDYSKLWVNFFLINVKSREGGEAVSRKLTFAGMMAMAETACTSSRTILNLGDMPGAVNRAWYAMFYAARAALIETGAPVDPNIVRKHKGLVSAFVQYVARDSLELSDMGRILNETHEARIEADYKVSFFKPSVAEEIVRQAENFVATIRGLDFDMYPEYSGAKSIAPPIPMDSMTEFKAGLIDLDTEAAVRRFLALIAPRYDIEAAILYGSRARGTHNEDSDADLAVLLRGDPDFRAALMDMAGVAFDVLLETDILISALSISLDEWENPDDYSNPALLHNIRREGILL